jgi:hypothetical protein
VYCTGILPYSTCLSLDPLTFKMKAAQSFVTSLILFQATRRHIPQDLNLQQQRCENLKCDNFCNSFSCQATTSDCRHRWFQFLINSFVVPPLLPTHSNCRGCLFSLDHTQTHTTVGRTPLNEGSARHRDLYLTTQTLYKRQTSMPPSGIRNHDRSKRSAADLRLRPCGHSDRLKGSV